MADVVVALVELGDLIFGGGIVAGSVILLGGEPGIGKSRLADELRQWVERQGHAAAATRAYAAEGSPAYAPIADWLRSAGLRAQIAQLEVIWLSEVARLLPELLVERPTLRP